MNSVAFYGIFERLKLCPGREAFCRFVETIMGAAAPDGQHPLEFIKSTGRISQKNIHPSLLSWLATHYSLVPAVEDLFAYYRNMGIAIPGSSIIVKSDPTTEFDVLLNSLKVSLGTSAISTFCTDILHVYPEGEIWSFLVSKKVLSETHISPLFREWIVSTPYINNPNMQNLLRFYERKGALVPIPKFDLDPILKFKCVTCRERILSVVVLPCYHLALCRECTVGKCPRCGVIVEGKLQVICEKQ